MQNRPFGLVWVTATRTLRPYSKTCEGSWGVTLVLHMLLLICWASCDRDDLLKIQHNNHPRQEHLPQCMVWGVLATGPIVTVQRPSIPKLQLYLARTGFACSPRELIQSSRTWQSTKKLVNILEDAKHFRNIARDVHALASYINCPENQRGLNVREFAAIPQDGKIIPALILKYKSTDWLPGYISRNDNLKLLGIYIISKSESDA